MQFSRQAEDLIADLRGIPVRRSRAIDRGAKPLDSIVEVCLERYHIGRETPEERILRHWPQIVGERWAGRCTPLRIDPRQRLHIGVANASLRRELQFHEDRVMTALRSLEGCDHLRGVIFRAG
ncbi:MAG: DUF721 domain-containing protein [Opitutales bacterium]